MTVVGSLRGIGKTYGGTVEALVDVDLDIESGEVLTISGPSGSGKSTMLNLIGLLDTPTGGSLSIAGVDVATAGERRRTALRARELGFVFQAFHLLPRRSVIENIALGGLYAGLSRRQRYERASMLVDDVGLSHRTHASVATLSGGERQRAAIARALLAEPSILLCDEPTGNLDSTRGEEVIELLQAQAARGTAVVIVTHDPTVARAGRRHVTIRDGRASGDLTTEAAAR